MRSLRIVNMINSLLIYYLLIKVILNVAFILFGYKQRILIPIYYIKPNKDKFLNNKAFKHRFLRNFDINQKAGYLFNSLLSI